MEAAKAFKYAQFLKAVDRLPISPQQSKLCLQFRQQAVAVLKPCIKVHGSSVADTIATCSACLNATTNLRLGPSSNLFWQHYVVSVSDATTLSKELWIGCSPTHKEIGYTYNKTLYLKLNFIHHGWQSNPNPTTATVWGGRPGREKQKAKRTLDPAWFLKGYFHHLARGQGEI